MDNFDAMTGRGFKIWFNRPELTPVDLEDIKYSAQNICRFNGHCKWSLLQHLTLCTLLAQYHLDPAMESTEHLIAQCACHDMHETYIGDVISGLKKYLADFQKIEALWETYVLSTFGLSMPTGTTKWFVKYIDNKALTLEMIGARHLSADRVAKIFGQPEEEETEIYEFVRELDPDACWFIINSAIETFKEGKENGENRIKQSDGIS